MNELWVTRWQHSSSHPIEAEWEHSVVNFAQEWLSHEIDAYNLAKQQFWAKIAHFQVDVYRPRIDSSGQIQFNRDMSKIRDVEFENDEQVRNFYKQFPDAESHFQNGMKTAPEVPTSTITHETTVKHTVTVTNEGGQNTQGAAAAAAVAQPQVQAQAANQPQAAQAAPNDDQIASMQMQMQQQMLEYQQLQNQLMMQAQQQQQMYQMAGGGGGQMYPGQMGQMGQMGQVGQMGQMSQQMGQSLGQQLGQQMGQQMAQPYAMNNYRMGGFERGFL